MDSRVYRTLSTSAPPEPTDGFDDPMHSAGSGAHSVRRGPSARTIRRAIRRLLPAHCAARSGHLLKLEAIRMRGPASAPRHSGQFQERTFGSMRPMKTLFFAPRYLIRRTAPLEAILVAGYLVGAAATQHARLTGSPEILSCDFCHGLCGDGFSCKIRDCAR